MNQSLSFSLLTLLLLLAQMRPASASPSVKFTAVDPLDSSSAAPSSFDWKTNVYFANFNASQEQKVHAAIALMKRVITSDEFRQRVLGHTYKGKKTFVDSGGLSNAEIYQKILEGAETMGKQGKNRTLDVELELYYAPTKTIGYTYPNVTRIWMNMKYFNKYTPVQVAGNLMHEWLHKLGFAHAQSWSKDRDHSVPYAIGYIMEELAREINSAPSF